jgi:hypothetical protein
MSSSPSSAALVFDDPEVKALFDAAAHHSLKSKACERGLKIHAFSVDTGLCAFCGKHENDLKNQQKQGQNR